MMAGVFYCGPSELSNAYVSIKKTRRARKNGGIARRLES